MQSLTKEALLAEGIMSHEDFERYWDEPRARKEGKKNPPTWAHGGAIIMSDRYKSALGKVSTTVTDAFFKKEGIVKPMLNVGRPPKKPRTQGAVVAGVDAAQQQMQIKAEFKQRCSTLAHENDSIGYRNCGEPFNRGSFQVAAAAAFDESKLNPEGTGLLAGAGPLELTIEQAAIVSYKLKNRLGDPLMEKGNVGACHAMGIAMEVLLLREELETCPSTVITVIDHGKDHYIDEVLIAAYEQHKREVQARGGGGGGDGRDGGEEHYEDGQE